MSEGGTMAVFRLNDPVRGFIDAVVLVGMTILAVLASLVLHRELLPLLLVVGRSRFAAEKHLK
jgi:hypothetical protein